MSDEIQALLKEAARRAHLETDDEPEPGMAGDVSWPMQVTIGKGLEGAIATSTQIGYVNGAKGWLVYRGYNVFDLAIHSTYEETAYLLLYGSLPSRRQLADFSRLLMHQRPVPPAVFEVLEKIPTARTHPMAALRTAVSVLGTLDESAEKLTVADETEVAVKLIAQLATLTGAIARIRHGGEPLTPRDDLGHAANLLYLMTGNEPDPLVARIMDIGLILHADHGMNASTFTTMVVNSSLADMYSSVVAGIGSLKGPLHGGANEQVLYDLEEIQRPENVEPWLDRAQASKRKINGFGHRVYKAYDPRARILGPLAELLSRRDPAARNLYEIAIRLDALMTSRLGREKKIFPNVDFYSGIVYQAMAIETAMFTPIFAVSRVAGWCARALEYLGDNRIFRPRAIYTGPPRMEYRPLDQKIGVSLARFEDRVPRLGRGTWIHPSADVFGAVEIGERCWIGPGARIRGDYGRIVIGNHTSVEDNCIIHARPGEQTTIGDWVTLGHGAIVHNATVRDWAVLGMGCIVSDWATIGVWAVVSEGAVVRQRGEVPDGRIAVGVPARLLDKPVGDEYKAEWTRFKEIYVELARRYPEGWRPDTRRAAESQDSGPE